MQILCFPHEWSLSTFLYSISVLCLWPLSYPSSLINYLSNFNTKFFHFAIVIQLLSCVSLQPQGLQHTRLPSPSFSPGVCANSCPLSRLCHPTSSSSVTPFSFCPQSFPALVFSSELALHIRRPKYWSFSFSPSSEYSGLISFRIDWFDLAVQGTLKSLLEHHNSKASILWLSTFFLVQHSHLYLTTGKTITLTLRTFPYSQSDVSAF